MLIQMQLTEDVIDPNFQVDTLVRHSANRKGKVIPPGHYLYSFEGCDHNTRRYISTRFKNIDIHTDSISYEETSVWEDGFFRILCDDAEGFKAYTGRDLFRLKKELWTMTVGKAYSPQYFQYGIDHEIDHNHGREHEHQVQAGRPIKWKRDYVYAVYFSKPPYNWSREQAEEWFDGYSFDEYDQDEFDPESNQVYYYPCDFVYDNYGCGKINYIRSVKDWHWYHKWFGNGLD